MGELRSYHPDHSLCSGIELMVLTLDHSLRVSRCIFGMSAIICSCGGGDHKRKNVGDATTTSCQKREKREVFGCFRMQRVIHR